MMFHRTDCGLYESRISVVDLENRKAALVRLTQELPVDSELRQFADETLQKLESARRVGAICT